MRQNLRTRLLSLMVFGIVLVTMANLIGSGWGLFRVRDRAINDSEQALENQLTTYLLELAESRAKNTNQILQAGQQVASSMSELVINPPPISNQKAVNPLVQSFDGRRYQQGETTVIVSNAPEISTLNEIIFSTPLEPIFPSVARLSSNISRVSYLTADGMLRTFPPVTPASVGPDWRPETDPGLQAAGPEKNLTRALFWTDVHRIFAGTEDVISAVQPIYRKDIFIGAIIVDIGVERLSTPLLAIKVGTNGFPMLLNQAGRLMVTTDPGQQRLLGRVVATHAERSAIQIEQINQGVAPLLQALKSTERSTTLIELGGERYLMAAAPIEQINWDVVFAYPFDEISATSQATTERIRDIAAESQLVNLAISLLLTGLIGIGLVYLLRQQLVKPLAALIEATQSVAAGELQTIDTPYNDEMGQLARSFNRMTQALSESQAALLANNQRLEQAVEERTAELHQSMQKTSAALTTQQELVETLNRVSSPVLPVIPGVLIMPLIGQFSAERARFATQELLQRIETSRVRLVLLDLTGVPVLDPSAAQALRSTVAASQLLGARTMLVGITPEVAQTLVALGFDLHDIDTAADLQSAITQVLRSRARAAGSSV